MCYWGKMPEFMFCIFGYCRHGSVILVFLQIGIKSIYTLKVFHFLTISFAQGIMVKQISYPNELDRDDEIIHLNKGRNTFLSNKDIKSRYYQNSNL